MNNKLKIIKIEDPMISYKPVCDTSTISTASDIKLEKIKYECIKINKYSNLLDKQISITIKPLTYLLDKEIKAHWLISGSYTRPFNCYMNFLEHNNNNEIIVFVPDYKAIAISYDLGETFNLLHYFKNNEKFFKVTNCLTTEKNEYLIHTNNKELFLFNKAWECKKITNITNGWLGRDSIDQNDNVIIFGEYLDVNSEVYVWRSDDYGNTFKKVLTVKGNINDKNDKDIRHFHTCQFNNNIWYITSGDTYKQCHLWISKDDGVTFKEILPNINVNNTTNIESIYYPTLFRHTTEYHSDKYIYWGTDQKLVADYLCKKCNVNLETDEPTILIKNKLCKICNHNEYIKRYTSRLVRFNKENDKLDVLNNLSNNSIRFTIPITDNVNLVISESTSYYSDKVEIYLYNTNGDSEKLYEIKNEAKRKTGFVNDKGSKSIINNTFFTAGDNIIIPRGYTLKWTVNIK